MTGQESPFTFGSLFSGIGGIDLGLERAGMQCAWQVEIDTHATNVLEKQWPYVTRFRDVRHVGKHNLTPVDLICGGFPCQDISQANVFNPQGLDGERSGLWSEFFRVICELQPRYVVVENVSALLYRGLGRVLGDLARIGYDAEWHMLQASDFGLPHERKRLFIIAYTDKNRRLCIRQKDNVQSGSGLHTIRQASDKMVLLRSMVAQLEQRYGTSSVCRADDGIPFCLDRLERIGNAVVPQIAEYIGTCILNAEGA